MKIRKLQLKNIGVFDDETIEFQAGPEGKAEIHILTGENGTGKTTILMGLAEFWGHKTDISTDEIHYVNISNLSYRKRFRSADRRSISLQDLNDNETQQRLAQYQELLNDYKKGEKPEMSFALFAYSGYRQITAGRVEALFVPKDYNPLAQSLDFIKDYSESNQITINQLIANNISNRALAKDDGSLEEAKKYEKVIKGIEEIIFEVTGKEIEFVLKRQPNELKLKIDGEELDFDVLSDGLRSLISWIADLLGRVELLKWKDNLPIFEKNLILFLVLLAF